MHYTQTARDRSRASLIRHLARQQNSNPTTLEGWILASKLTEIMNALKRKLGVSKIEINV